MGDKKTIQQIIEERKAKAEKPKTSEVKTNYSICNFGIAEAMDFGGALKILKAGGGVARKGWHGKGIWLALVKPDMYYLIGDPIDGSKRELLPWICMKTADNKYVPWLASQTDVLAEDWIEVKL